MSYIIPRNKISEENAEIIKNCLTISQPNEFNGIPSTFQFYIYEGGMVYIPYCFAAGLFGLNPNIDNPHRKINTTFNGILKENQIDPSKEILEILNNYGSGILNLSTGYGKTFIATYTITQINYVTAIITPMSPLPKQWSEEIKKNTNAKIWIFGDEPQPEHYDIIILMNLRIKNLPQNIIDEIGYLIIDEAHMICTKENVKNILKLNPRYVLSLTATLRRNRDKDMITALCGDKMVIRNTNDDNVKEEDFKLITVHRIKTYFKPEFVINFKTQKPDYNIMKKSLVTNDDRNIYICHKILKNFEKSIVLTELESHVHVLKEMLICLGLTCDTMSKNKKNYKDSQVLIGTMSKISTGFDEKNLCMDFKGELSKKLYILCTTKSVCRIVQSSGRIRNKEAEIYIFVDNHSIYDRHWNVNYKEYTSMKAKIVYERLDELEMIEIKENHNKLYDKNRYIEYLKVIEEEKKSKKPKKANNKIHENNEKIDEEKSEICIKECVEKKPKRKYVKKIKQLE